MSDHGDDEEGHRLLDEAAVERPLSEEYDVEAESGGRPSRSSSGTSIWVSLGLFIVALVLTLPFLGYMRHGKSTQGTSSPPPKQLAIALYPENHAFRDAKTLEFHWNVTLGKKSPDGVEKAVYLVNGVFPGPTIEARSGDRIIVHVHNTLESEGLALHWHGLRMKGSNSMDGAVGFTQCPIPAGGDFVYDFRIGEDESGTFWWHSHSQVQRGDGLYGGLVVHQPGVKPTQREALVLLGDWFHRKQTDVFDWYFDWGSLGNEPVPDSVLVNGRGRYNCSMAVPARPVVCNQVETGDVLPLLAGEQRSPVKLRLVNTGTVAGVTVAVDGATIQPVAIDGGFAVRDEPGSSAGILYPGERADVVVRWDEGAQGSNLHVDLDDENFGGFPNPALNPNHTFSIFPPRRDNQQPRQENSPPILPDDHRHRDLAKVVAASPPSSTLPSQAQETLVLYFKTQLLSRFENKPLGFVNNTSWKPQSPPLLATARAAWNDDQFVPFIKSDARRSPTDVDIVINNLDDGSHPIHLHGYSFYVLSSYRAEGRSGWGSYNPYEDEPLGPMNLVDPIRKDTVSVPRRGHVVIRVRADNPGLWMMHCHMLVHMGTGMATGLHVGVENGAVDEAAATLCAPKSIMSNK
ncbi:hypothetical protein QQS21_001397 [Conoideocrella luteorostrata]|uniref:Multicopper oxidase n=1 Tax=Conoideocrella luteorostrata TaxID=1105319 RepID=A0AAJ0CX95_9HYPO|nr:hypothetical protein QQS21_001397 [Conoideocrella luteorostrata]